MKIEERCGCGASIVVEGKWASSAEKAAGTWRKDHQHIVPDPDDVRLDVSHPTSSTTHDLAWASRPYWSVIDPSGA